MYSAKKSPKDKRKRTLDSDLLNPQVLVKQIKDQHYESKVISYLGRNGIEVASYKTRYLVRRIRVRMGRLRFDSYKVYYEYLMTHAAEIKELQEALSINVTRFFRNRDTFEYLRDRILPEMAQQTRSQNRAEIKIWSAGCAVGPEPYTTAIIVSDSILHQIIVKIQASDIKNELLAIARNGVYTEPYLAELTDGEITKHFFQNSQDNYVVNQNLRKMINFVRHDLMKDNYPTNLDLILCRNVLIYVDRDAQKQIIAKFFEALRPGGVLVLGRTETLFGDWRNHVDIVSTKHRIYRKKLVTNFSGKVEPKPLVQVGQKMNRIKTVNVSHTQRLQELKNFRKTFEERRKIWADKFEKIADDRDKIRNRLKAIGLDPDNKTPVRSRSKATDQADERKLNLQEGVETGRLANYRKRLKKARKPISIRSTERDQETKTQDALDYRLPPDQLYKKLKRRRERSASR